MDGLRPMKNCAKCQTEKPLSDYNKNSTGRGDGHMYYCKECQSAYYKAYTAAMRDGEAKVKVSAKVCRDCSLEKPISQFGTKSTSPDKHQIYCKLCWRQRVLIAQRKYNAKKR